QELELELGGVERVADLVSHARREPADEGQHLGLLRLALQVESLRFIATDGEYGQACALVGGGALQSKTRHPSTLRRVVGAAVQGMGQVDLEGRRHAAGARLLNGRLEGLTLARRGE